MKALSIVVLVIAVLGCSSTESGSSKSGGKCEVTADDACTACVMGRCESSCAVCNGSDACVDAIQCHAACGSDTECVDNCNVEHFIGASQYDAWESCIIDRCASACLSIGERACAAFCRAQACGGKSDPGCMRACSAYAQEKGMSVGCVQCDADNTICQGGKATVDTAKCVDACK